MKIFLGIIGLIIIINFINSKYGSNSANNDNKTEIKDNNEDDNKFKNKEQYEKLIDKYIDEVLDLKKVRLVSSFFKLSVDIPEEVLKDVKKFLSKRKIDNISTKLIKKIMRKKLEKVIPSRAKPEIKKFINNYITSDLLRLPKVNLVKKDVEAFQDFLSENKGINIESQELFSLIKDEMVKMFKNEIEKESNTCNWSSLESLTKTYISVYENNIDNDYIEWFIKIYSNHNDLTYDAPLVEEIKELIENEFDKMSRQNKLQKITAAMESNSNLSKKITIDDIDLMEGEEFERFLRKLFSKMGYNAEITKKTGDQGADLIIEKYGGKTVVQAKRYSNSVSNSSVQEIIGAKEYYNATEAMVVTNNYFTKSAKELAKANNVSLWNRDKLMRMMDDYSFDMANYL